MKPFAVIKVGTTVPAVRERRGDFERFFLDGLGIDEGAAHVVQPQEGDELPDPSEISGTVVTGASAMVTDHADWSLRTEEWIGAVLEAGTPMLAVCYGHQLLGRVVGGEVGWNSAGREIGTVTVNLTPAAGDDLLFTGLPETLAVQTTHSQSVLNLPEDLPVLATNDHDHFQAFRAGPRAWGIQFHPEFDAEIVRGYLEDRRSEISAEGIDVDERLQSLSDSAWGTQILRRFAGLIGI